MDTIIKRLLENRYRFDEENSPDEQYREYLEKHIQGVKDVYENVLYPVLLTESDLTVEEFNEIESIIEQHDASKYGKEEFKAYMNHFYGSESSHNADGSHTAEYNEAWNHHQKHNPHHWQYWCLIDDVSTPQLNPLDIPFIYIIEMLCDWQSAGAHYGNTAYEWYQKQKDKMILSDTTRGLVEKYIEYLK